MMAVAKRWEPNQDADVCSFSKSGADAARSNLPALLAHAAGLFETDEPMLV